MNSSLLWHWNSVVHHAGKMGVSVERCFQRYHGISASHNQSQRWVHALPESDSSVALHMQGGDLQERCFRLILSAPSPAASVSLH